MTSIEIILVLDKIISKISEIKFPSSNIVKSFHFSQFF